MNKTVKRILIAIVILIFIASFISCMYTDLENGVDRTFFMRMFMRKL